MVRIDCASAWPRGLIEITAERSDRSPPATPQSVLRLDRSGGIHIALNLAIQRTSASTAWGRMPLCSPPGSLLPYHALQACCVALLSSQSTDQMQSLRSTSAPGSPLSSRRRTCAATSGPVAPLAHEILADAGCIRNNTSTTKLPRLWCLRIGHTLP